jgi:hypothetical protein
VVAVFADAAQSASRLRARLPQSCSGLCECSHARAHCLQETRILASWPFCFLLAQICRGYVEAEAKNIRTRRHDHILLAATINVMGEAFMKMLVGNRQSVLPFR